MSEYNLTIMDIDWEDGNLYETKSGEKFLVLHNALTHYDTPNFNITDAYLLKDILSKKFRKIIDWSKMPVDTKILVKCSQYDSWKKQHFAKYENGHVYTWNDGLSSWSCYNKKNVSHWKYAKLATEEE